MINRKTFSFTGNMLVCVCVCVCVSVCAVSALPAAEWAATSCAPTALRATQDHAAKGQWHSCCPKEQLGLSEGEHPCTSVRDPVELVELKPWNRKCWRSAPLNFQISGGKGIESQVCEACQGVRFHCWHFDCKSSLPSKFSVLMIV